MKRLFLNEKMTYSFVCNHTEIDNPLTSDCGRFYYDSRYKPSETLLTDRGFYIENTGGGCTAWAQSFLLGNREVYIWISNDNISHECEDNELMHIGIFDKLDTECIISWTSEGDRTIHKMDFLPVDDQKQFIDEQQNDDELANEALDQALAFIQKRLGIETGDYAGQFFDNGHVQDQLIVYIKNERKNKRGLI
jgi:hypothetical protein